MGSDRAAGGKGRILYDPQTNAFAELPPGAYDLVVGREAYGGLPVPILAGRMAGDSRRLKAEIKDRRGRIMAAVVNTISRHHAILFVSESGVTVRDAGSREGTKVNGASLKGSDKHLLGNRDEVQVSAWSLVYYDDPGDIEEVRRKEPEAYRIDAARLEG